MQRDIITVPRSLMLALDMTWDIDWRQQSNSASLADVSQTVVNAFPRWVGTPSLRLRREQILTWRALRAEAQGMKNLYRLDIVDPLGFDALEFGVQASVGIPHSTGPLFSTGMGYAAVAVCLNVGAASQGATTLRIDVSPVGGRAPKQGQILSHADWPFLVTSVVDAGTDLYDVTIRMPLRAAIPDGAEIHMQAQGLFEIVEPQMGVLNYGRNHIALPSFSFREVLNR
ncbi:hypothetical protein FHY55_19485 [Oceanicola sp. D3]|uniref:hypothetical protein n=1 Tax=Oceanicola sp. D3 TaxID=2587163 RepID=UPI0011222DB5|nr:hypothetical protein [Oceanicola sp. D3]QDC11282.1 hypothetical protein FHY55_19485 [Oceanicola sp. D3]